MQCLNSSLTSYRAVIHLILEFESGLKFRAIYDDSPKTFFAKMNSSAANFVDNITVAEVWRVR